MPKRGQSILQTLGFELICRLLQKVFSKWADMLKSTSTNNLFGVL
jgi:hypothetical protein